MTSPRSDGLAAAFAKGYVRARASIWWILGFNGAIVLYIIGHILWDWDPVYAVGLLVLSIEASSSTSFLIRDQAKAEMLITEIHKLQQQMVRQGNAILAIVEPDEEEE